MPYRATQWRVALRVAPQPRCAHSTTWHRSSTSLRPARAQFRTLSTAPMAPRSRLSTEAIATNDDNNSAYPQASSLGLHGTLRRIPCRRCSRRTSVSCPAKFELLQHRRVRDRLRQENHMLVDKPREQTRKQSDRKGTLRRSSNRAIRETTNVTLDPARITNSQSHTQSPLIRQRARSPSRFTRRRLVVSR